MMENILVTGGAGYIGSVLVPNLLEKGYRVTVLDNFMYKQTSLAHSIRNPNLELVYGDVRDSSLMKKVIKSADVIIPLAAIVGAPACDLDPIAAESINKNSVIELLGNLSKSQRIIMPTTNSAYGSGDEKNYCDENSPLNPLSRYARDKVEVEKALFEVENFTSLRLATVFGLSNRMRLDLLVNNFAFRAVCDGFVIIFEGHFKRNYIHVSDVVQAFELALDYPSKFNKEVFNVGLSTANISKLDLCKEIQKIMPSFVYLESNYGKDPDQRNYVVSNSKIESMGFQPKISLQSGLQELIKGMKMYNHKPFTNI
jgi:nucleoside-diphosphate-sugar epimerase